MSIDLFILSSSSDFCFSSFSFSLSLNFVRNLDNKVSRSLVLIDVLFCYFSSEVLGGGSVYARFRASLESGELFSSEFSCD